MFSEIDASQIRAPAGHRLAPEQLQALQPQVQHPPRLVFSAEMSRTTSSDRPRRADSPATSESAQPNL
jgi:hypothetical protein